MTEDYVVSCWYIPLQGKRGNTSYQDLLMRYADTLDGNLMHTAEGEWVILVREFSISPGDTFCQYLSGKFGVKRG